MIFWSGLLLCVWSTAGSDANGNVDTDAKMIAHVARTEHTLQKCERTLAETSWYVAKMKDEVTATRKHVDIGFSIMGMIGIVAALVTMIAVLSYKPTIHGHARVVPQARSAASPMAIYLPKKRKSECLVCFETNVTPCVLSPCGHGGVCRECADQLHCCPFCRLSVHGAVPIVWQQ